MFKQRTNDMKTLFRQIDRLRVTYIFFLRLQWKISKISFLVAVLSALLTTVNSLAVVMFPGLILDFLAKGDRRNFLYTVIVFAAWELLVAFFKAVVKRVSEAQNRKISDRINHMLVEKATSLRYEQLESPEILELYETAKKCVNDNRITQFMSGTISLIFSLAELISLLYVLKSMPLWVLAVFVAVTVVNAVVNMVISKNTVEEAEEEIPVSRVMRYFSYELIKPAYAKEMRAFDLGSYVFKRHSESIDELIDIEKKYYTKRARFINYSSVAGKALSVTFYIYCIFRFYSGLLTVGEFTTSLNAMFRFSQVTNSAVSKLTEISTRGILLGKTMDYLNITSSALGTKPVAPWEKDGTIEFVDVSYRYPNSKDYALKNVSLTIRFGEKISVVGPNGAGKTTLIGLMLGLFRPTEGKILYNGTDVEELDFAEYRNRFSVLLQDYQIYNFTILENLTFAENPADSEYASALEAIEKIGLKNKTEALPNKERSFISQMFDENGIRLSGGEEQKLAIARAIYQNSDIFILDEPTSALSPVNEYEIYRHFADKTGEKTVMYISHRLSSCSLCSRIIVLNNGMLTEDGSHAELMKNNSLYASMYRTQAELFI